MTECGACGSPLPSDGEHCPACGAGAAQADELRSWASVGQDEPAAGVEEDRPASPPPHRHLRWPGLALIVAGLALIAAGAYTTYRGERGVTSGIRPGVGRSQPVRPTTQSGASATPGASAAATSPASQEPPVVTVAPALRGRPDVADVVGTLTTYFTAINHRDYQAYRSVLVGADQRVRDEQDFLTRFRSTADSEVWLVGIRRDSAGEVFATVAFRSRQDPVDSPDLVSDCLSWVVTYPMTRIDGAVRIDVVRTFAQTHRPC